MKTILKTRPAIFIFAVGISALISILVVIHLINSSVQQSLTTEISGTYDVKKGASLSAVIKDLSDEKLIEPDVFLKLAIKLNTNDYAPKIGHYEILPGMTLDAFLTDLTKGKEKTYNITMIEGQTWQQWYSQLKDHPVLVQDVKEDELLEILAIEAKSLEGLLLPETYNVRFGTRLSEFVTRMHQDMQRYLSQTWQDRQGMLPIHSEYEALILASIIEKETGVASERSHIASVFVNRLRKGMRLQTDPTVIYGLGERYNGDITRAHLREKTPYNTYVINGLPPTPIAMPGKAAIDATVNPALTEDFYFVSKGDGTHKFSKTLKEHNTAVRKYQLGLD